MCFSNVEDKPCEDNVTELSKNGVTCAILNAQGCEANLYELSLQQEMAYPEGMPKEARVKDACPQTCKVCDGKAHFSWLGFLLFSHFFCLSSQNAHLDANSEIKETRFAMTLVTTQSVNSTWVIAVAIARFPGHCLQPLRLFQLLLGSKLVKAFA